MAAATGNVTNQAVQFQNNGAPSRQAFGNNISCNGSTMTFSPFYMGNDTEPQTEDGYVITENWGFQINFSVPLNRDLTKQCERMAESQIQKNKLDFELVRALKCAELQQKGFTLLPGSRVYTRDPGSRVKPFCCSSAHLSARTSSKSSLFFCI